MRKVSGESRRRGLPILGASDGGEQESRMAVLTDVPPRPADYTLGTPLVDSRGRRYRYLRFSVTDRCDMRCIYCMPPGGEEEHSLRK